jgi:hypothetical protein
MDQSQNDSGNQQGSIPGTDIPDLPRTPDQFFSIAEYQFKSKLISSPFASAIFENISSSDLSQQCKLEFYKVLVQAFDSNAMLARNINIAIRYIDLDIILNLMIIGCHESDIQNPAFLTIQENIKQAFRDFVSPSEGGKARDDIQKSTQRVEYTGIPGSDQRQQPGMQQSQQMQQPRGIRRFGGGEQR